MNQIEINKIVTSTSGTVEPLEIVKEEWVITINQTETYKEGLRFTPSQMKELKEKIAKLDL